MEKTGKHFFMGQFTIDIAMKKTGKRLHNYGTIHSFSWENSGFQWPFSIAMLKKIEGTTLS